jgi:hypothetical protein
MQGYGRAGQMGMAAAQSAWSLRGGTATPTRETRVDPVCNISAGGPHQGPVATSDIEARRVPVQATRLGKGTSPRLEREIGTDSPTVGLGDFTGPRLKLLSRAAPNRASVPTFNEKGVDVAYGLRLGLGCCRLWQWLFPRSTLELSKTSSCRLLVHGGDFGVHTAEGIGIAASPGGA